MAKKQKTSVPAESKKRMAKCSECGRTVEVVGNEESPVLVDHTPTNAVGTCSGSYTDVDY